MDLQPVTRHVHVRGVAKHRSDQRTQRSVCDNSLYSFRSKIIEHSTMEQQTQRVDDACNAEQAAAAAHSSRVLQQ